MRVVGAFEWACVLCDHCIQNDYVSRAMNLHQILCNTWTFLLRNYLDDSEGRSYGQLVIGSFIMIMCPLRKVFWCNIKSPRWLSPPLTQIWCPATSVFSLNLNHLWEGRDFRLLMRFRKIWWGSWWWLGKLCEVPRCLLWRGLGVIVLMFLVSWIFFNKCLYFSYYMAEYLLDRPSIFSYS